LDKLLENLTAFYLPVPEDKEMISQNLPQKLKWTGRVASIVTMFLELHTECYDDHLKPFLQARRNELVRFISNNFVDENSGPFAESSLATHLDRS
jgi:hypothetical protein